MSDTCHNLEQKILIYPKSMQSFIPEGLKLDERKEHLGIVTEFRDFHPNVERFEEMSKLAQAKQRQYNWTWRVGEAASQFSLMKWYPFFVTLTVDPTKVENTTGLTPEEFWKKGKYYTRYKRDIADTVCRVMGHKLCRHSGVPESNYAQFFGVLEHGKTREHHHMHVLIWMRDIPSEWKQCPNRFIRNAKLRNRQRCLPLESLWKWASPLNKPALYFRHQNDIWKEHGFVTPVLKTGKPLKLYPATRAGTYCAKYLGKDTKEWQHRVKATQNLGLQRLKDLLARIHGRRLEALTWRPKKYHTNIFLQTIHSVPHGLIRSIAKQIYFCRRWATNSLDFDKLMNERFEGYNAMLTSVRNGAKPHKMGSAQLYDWVSQHLPEPEGYCDKRLVNAHKCFSDYWPVVHSTPTQTIGGNRI